MNRLFVLSFLCLSIKTQMLWASADAIQFVPPHTDEKADPRDRPRGGGSRPICQPPNALTCESKAMVALVPPSQPAGMTISTTPRLWFFSPYDSDEPLYASFELVDEQGISVWQDFGIQLMSQPGLFAYQIPREANLKTGQMYRWYLNVHLAPDHPSSDVLLSARLIYHSAPDPNELSALEQLTSLANQGIWYDLVNGLAQMNQSQRTLWETFLINHGFEDLVPYPVHQSSL